MVFAPNFKGTGGTLICMPLKKCLDFTFRYRVEAALFCAVLVSRVVAIVFSNDMPNSFSDAAEYIELADRMLSGNFDFGLYRFIRSPFYSMVIATQKILFPMHWMQAMVFINVIASLAAGVFLYFLTKNLFQQTAARFALAFYIIYVPIYHQVWAIGTELLYLAFVSIFLWAFEQSLRTKKLEYLLIFTFFLFLANITRSIAFAVYFPLLLFYLYAHKFHKHAVHKSAIAMAAFILLSTPVALVNWRHHKTPAISSNGTGFLFLNSNSEVGYLDGFEMKHISIDRAYYVKNFSEYGEKFWPEYREILKLPQQQKQKAFFSIGFNWIKENKVKFLQLKLLNVLRLLVPGKHWLQVDFMEWILSFLVGLPLYVFFYLGIILLYLDREFKKLILFTAFIIPQAVVLTILLYTYRYKVYSMDLLWLVVAGYGVDRVLTKLSGLRGASDCN